MTSDEQARRWPQIRLVRLLVVGLVALGVLWWSMRITIGFVLAASNPAIAIRWWPSADVQATQASQLLAGDATSRANQEQATKLAKDALRRQAVSPKAAGTLGLIEALRGRQQEALRDINYSERLSRRELQTQLWLIEHQVALGDIDGALVHYDRAMTTKPSSRAMLIPVLVKASDDPAVAASLARVLARRPIWWSEFLGQAIPEMKVPASIARILAGLRLRTEDRGERELFGYALNRLVSLKGYGEAFALYGAVRPGAKVPIRNPDFEAANDLPPLDWALSDDAELGAVIQPKPERPENRVLFLNALSGRSGVVARQILRLSPGRYRLSLIAGDIPADKTGQPAVTLQCAGGTVLILDMTVSKASMSAGEFGVPAQRCAAQWLSVTARPTGDVDAPQPWIDALRIVARPGGL